MTDIDAFDAQLATDQAALFASPGPHEAVTIIVASGINYPTRAFVTRTDTLGQYASNGQAALGVMTVLVPFVGFAFDETADKILDRNGVTWRVEHVKTPGATVIGISVSSEQRLGL